MRLRFLTEIVPVNSFEGDRRHRHVQSTPVGPRHLGQMSDHEFNNLPSNLHAYLVIV